MPSPEHLAWQRALDEMEKDLSLVWAALDGRAPYPGTFSTPTPAVAVPKELKARAARLVERQHVAEECLRDRVESFGRFLFASADAESRAPASVNVRV